MNKPELIKRFYALIWSSGAMLASGLLDLAGQSLHLFNLPDWAVITLGLLVTQGTKALRNYIEANKNIKTQVCSNKKK